MSEQPLVEVWDEYYGESGDTAIKDKPFFDLEVRTLVDRLQREVKRTGAERVVVLELGSGTGYLAARIAERLAEMDVELRFDGVDFSDVGVGLAAARELPGCTFHRSDFLAFLDATDERYDVIVAQRSIMAIMEADDQTRLLELVRDHLAPGGLALLSEGSIQGMERLNGLRTGLELEPMETVWHSRYLDEREIDTIFGAVETEHFAPLYWLVTRVLYPYFEEPQHDTPLHRFAATLPQVGDFAPVRLFAVRA
jgi:predicted TPR repeat methyltransferase